MRLQRLIQKRPSCEGLFFSMLNLQCEALEFFE